MASTPPTNTIMSRDVDFCDFDALLNLDYADSPSQLQPIPSPSCPDDHNNSGPCRHAEAMSGVETLPATQSLDQFDNAPIQGSAQTELPAFEDFKSWLPFYNRPPNPCDYCSSRGMSCHGIP